MKTIVISLSLALGFTLGALAAYSTIWYQINHQVIQVSTSPTGPSNLEVIHDYTLPLTAGVLNQPWKSGTYGRYYPQDTGIWLIQPARVQL